MNASPREVFSHVASTSGLLPWLIAANADASIIACKDSSLLGVWEISGIDAEAVDGSVFSLCFEQLDNLYRRLASYRVAVWTQFLREPHEHCYAAGEFTNAVARFVDEEWRNTFDANPPYRNRIYIAAAMPTTSAKSSFGSMVADRMADGEKPLRAVLASARDSINGAKKFGYATHAELSQACDRFESIIGNSMMNMLTTLQARRLRGDELLGYLKSSASANRQAPVAMDGSAYLDGALSDTDIDNAYADYLVMRGHSTRYVAAFSLKEAPGAHKMHALAQLSAMPIDLRVVNCWRPVSTREADKVIAGARTWDEMRMMTPRRLITTMMNQSKGAVDVDDAPKTQIGAVAQSYREDLRRGQAAFGWAAWSVLVYADSPEDLDDKAKKVMQELERSKLVFMRETDGSLSALCVGIPGHLREIVRWHLTEASNQSEATPTVSIPTGIEAHPYYSTLAGHTVPPNATFRSRYDTVQYFNYHNGELGHTLIVGPSRNGKTMLQAFLQSQMMKYPNSMVFNFDKDYSLMPPTLMHGGAHIDLSPVAASGRIRLNPMLECRTEAGRNWLVGWLDRLFQERGDRLTDRQVNAISQVLENFANRFGREGGRQDEPVSLSSLAAVLDHDLSDRLKTWTRDGAFGAFFDHEEDDFSLSNYMTIEIGGLLGSKMESVVRAFTDYAFYRIEKFMANRNTGAIGPTQIYIEEAGFLLDDPIFISKARDYLMTLAKKGANLVMTAQSPEVFVKHEELRAAVRDNIATIIFLPNSSATSVLAAPMYRDAFGVGDDQLQIIAGARMKREYCVYRPANGTFRVLNAEFPNSIVDVLRSDTLSLSVFRNFYSSIDPEWRGRYLKALAEKRDTDRRAGRR